MKNLLSLVVTLLFTISSFAQLYVKPTVSGDASYIYVKDEVLFVEDDISLEENSASTTEKASIYFRDDAQLIQGTGTTASSGDGYISILQTNPDADAWDYTFWGSPVGDQTIAGTGNKNFGALRFFNPQGTKDVGCDCFLGTDSKVNVPITNHNGEYNPDMKISKRWLYTYTNAGGWSRINDASSVLSGLGFTMKGLGTVNHDQTYDFRGRANNGTIAAPITAGDLNLSGNPYPSALDLNQVFYDNNPKIESFRFWDEDRTVDSHYYVDNKGGYGIWVPMGADPGGTNPGVYTEAPFLNYNNDGSTGTGQTGTGRADYERRFAPVGQGFMLYGTTSGFITYENSQRVYIKQSSGMSDFRSNDRDPVVNDGSDSAIDVISARPPDNRISHLRLNTYFNETHMRQMVLAFSNESTDGFDRGFDASSPMDSTSDAYFPIGDEEKDPFVIQTVPYDIYKQIPYAIVLEAQTRVVVNLIEKVKFEGSVYLYDNVEDTYQEIKTKSDWGGSAEMNLPPGAYEDRFFISFVNRHRTQQVAIENTKNQVLEDVGFFQNNSAKQLEVANPEGYDIASANIFGMSGKLVSASNLGNSTRFAFPTGNLSDGIYLVMLTTTENIAVNYKITVHNY